MSIERERQAEFEMQQLLESIPLSKHFPIPHYEALDRAIGSLEKSIKRLKAFVHFLSLLSPAKYIEWMKQAYAQYVPSKVNSSLGEPYVHETATVRNNDKSSKVRSEKVASSTTTPNKKYLPTP